MTSRCARCVGLALPPTVCTAPMGRDLRATPTRTDTSDSGEKQRTSGKKHTNNGNLVVINVLSLNLICLLIRST